ncbi:MAG TPA: HAMP domain-containing protein, partial [Anaerovoracaceae bacterium]|nr:HAMP domain-containing protein [Anaerovoracaceae bacterium]
MLNKINLSKKILILIGIPIIIAFCVTALITLNSVDKSVSKLNLNELSAQSVSTSNEIETLFTKYLEVAKQMAANPQIEDLFLKTNPGTVITTVDGFPQVKKNLDNVKATDPDNIVVSWVGDIDSSQFTQSDGYTSGADYVITERGWYKDLIKKQEAFITEPYEDTATKSIIISVVAPVYKSGTKELIGATCIDVSIDSIKAMLKEMKVGKTGFYIMTTGTGQVFYHPNEKYYNLNVAETKMSNNIKDALLNKTSGEIAYTVDSQKIHGYTSPIGNTGWMIVSGLPNKEFDSTFNAVRATVLIIFGLVLLIIISLIFFMSGRITKPLKKVVYMIEEMGKGHFKERLNIKSGDEIGQIAVIMNQFADKLQSELITTLNMISDGNVNIDITLTDQEDEITPALKKTIETLRNLNSDTEAIIQAITEGKLDTRGNAEAYSGTWKELVLGINGLTDAFVVPIHSTSEYINRISKGDIPSRITEEYKGDFNEIKNSINGLIDVMNGILGETDKLIKSTREGELDTRGNTDELSGDWSTLLNGVNEIINSFVTSIDTTAQYVDRISKGDIPEKITDTYYGDFNEIKNNINGCIDAMNGLLGETNKLIQAAQDGQLEVRANADTFSGEWGTLVGGMNNLVDAFVKPINQTSEYVDRISKGDIPAKIIDTYHGDFNETKNNLNNCIDIMSGMLHETNKLIGAAQEGQLDIRANTEGFTGSWDELIGGMNRLVETVVKPIKEVTAVMNDISEGNLEVSVKGNYQGEFGVLSAAVNNTARDLNSVVGEISEVIGQISDGNLTISNVTAFKGDFVSISDSLNTILESLNSVLGDINMASDQVSIGSKQVSDGSQALSQGATEQASSIQELTASVTEVAEKTKGN